ncbi:hypothetical protein QVD99_007709 [Batrachochytrium dendrobatidis]|nr:hypothetical protein O5D80_001366 [Batrachochytrium dendrobatidis]KAK5665352.1 hypothetical protein QVD99_007709 [Batrachochytrium dendrobatidis]
MRNEIMSTQDTNQQDGLQSDTTVHHHLQMPGNYRSKEMYPLLDSLSQSSGSIQNTVHELSKIQSQPCFPHHDNHLNCDPRHAWVQQEQLRLSNEACIRQIQPSDIAKNTPLNHTQPQMKGYPSMPWSNTSPNLVLNTQPSQDTPQSHIHSTQESLSKPSSQSNLLPITVLSNPFFNSNFFLSPMHQASFSPHLSSQLLMANKSHSQNESISHQNPNPPATTPYKNKNEPQVLDIVMPATTKPTPSMGLHHYRMASMPSRITNLQRDVAPQSIVTTWIPVQSQEMVHSKLNCPDSTLSCSKPPQWGTLSDFSTHHHQELSVAVASEPQTSSASPKTFKHRTSERQQQQRRAKQNREAQRSFRTRHKAYVQQLEQRVVQLQAMVAVAKSSSGWQDERQEVFNTVYKACKPFLVPLNQVVCSSGEGVLTQHSNERNTSVESERDMHSSSASLPSQSAITLLANEIVQSLKAVATKYDTMWDRSINLDSDLTMVHDNLK